jgi:cobalt-zinc-cadmium efflux system outer membrane protein
MTLDEALRRAEEMSPAARIAVLGVDRARAEADASGLWPNPELSLVREESAGVVERFANLSQELPWSGRLGLERSAARAGLEAAEAAARQERFELRARVRESFIDLLLAQERAAALEAGRARLGDLVGTLRAREQEGESSGFDRMRAERELAEVEADRIEEGGRLLAARSALSALVSCPAEGLAASGRLEGASGLPAQEQLQAILATRGDLVAMRAEAESADLRAQAARRRVIPEPTLALGAKSTEAGDLEDTGPTVAIGFPLPIFDRGQAAGAGRAEASLLLARHDSLARLAASELEARYADAVARRDAERRYVDAADPEDLVRIAGAAYEEGAMGILELLDAGRTALTVRLRILDLHAAARRAEVALGRAVGQEVTP